MNSSDWITLITGVGVGSLVTAVIQFQLKKRETQRNSQRAELEKRYRVVVLLMYAAYDFDSNASPLQIHRPDLKSVDDVVGDLKADWHNMLLFASEGAILALGQFIQNPNADNMKSAANAMRIDLERGELSHEIRTFDI